MEFKDLGVVIINFMVLIIMVMVGVAFFTLLERKVLGYIQIRKGPNKMGILGLFQPFCDAIKLFSKEQMVPLVSNFFIYYFCPLLMLFLSLVMWISLPFVFKMLSFNLGMLFILCCLGLGSYGVILAGWSSNSVFALLGGLRSVAQIISYEVSFILLLLSVIVFIDGFNLIMLLFYQKSVWFMIIMFPLSVIWLISCLAETNRSPFDFAEGESELVSGFNVEYMSGMFALIFLGEYVMIMFMSMLFMMLFLGGLSFAFFTYLKILFIMFMYIWVRGIVPRFRYDMLMYLAWKKFLPFSLNYLMLVLGVKLFMTLMIYWINLSMKNKS